MFPRSGAPMQCADCDDEIDEAVKVKVGKRTLKLCEECADVRREKAEIGEEAEGAMQSMMGFKGRF